MPAGDAPPRAGVPACVAPPGRNGLCVGNVSVPTKQTLFELERSEVIRRVSPTIMGVADKRVGGA